MVYIKNKTKVFPFKSLSSDFFVFDSDKNLENSRKKEENHTHTHIDKTPHPTQKRLMASLFNQVAC